jgi:hypothetical protein
MAHNCVFSVHNSRFVHLVIRIQCGRRWNDNERQISAIPPADVELVVVLSPQSAVSFDSRHSGSRKMFRDVVPGRFRVVITIARESVEEIPLILFETIFLSNRKGRGHSIFVALPEDGMEVAGNAVIVEAAQRIVDDDKPVFGVITIRQELEEGLQHVIVALTRILLHNVGHFSLNVVLTFAFDDLIGHSSDDLIVRS